MPASPSLIQKINDLPSERVAEVEDFVDFLRQRDLDRSLRAAFAEAGAPAFEAIWSNPEDDVYDAI